MTDNFILEFFSRFMDTTTILVLSISLRTVCWSVTVF